MELGGSESQRFVFLVLRPGEDDNIKARLGRELNGDMTKAANSKNTNAVSRLETMFIQRAPYR